MLGLLFIANAAYNFVFLFFLPLINVINVNFASNSLFWQTIGYYVLWALGLLALTKLSHHNLDKRRLTGVMLSLILLTSILSFFVYFKWYKRPNGLKTLDIFTAASYTVLYILMVKTVTE